MNAKVILVQMEQCVATKSIHTIAYAQLVIPEQDVKQVILSFSYINRNSKEANFIIVKDTSQSNI